MISISKEEEKKEDCNASLNVPHIFKPFLGMQAAYSKIMT